MDKIKTPVRYDAKHHHIFEADGHSLCWLTRNTHHPEWDKKDEAGQQIANALNTAADQSRVIEVMRTALEATARASRQTLDIIQKENFVFDGSGDRWEKLAFTIYTELTQASTDAKDALAEAQRILEGE